MIQTAPTVRTPLGSDRDTYLQPVLRDRGNKTATERCKNPATRRTKPQLVRRYAVQVRGGSSDGSEEWINLIVTLEPSEQPIGYVQATVPRRGGATEIAWVIGQPWQGHGYATEAAKQLSTHLAARGITRLIAHIHPEHTASQRIAARLGMTPTSQVVDGEVRWERG